MYVPGAGTHLSPVEPLELLELVDPLLLLLLPDDELLVEPLELVDPLELPPELELPELVVDDEQATINPMIEKDETATRPTFENFMRKPPRTS